MPEITQGPLHASRIEFCYLASCAHVGVWWRSGQFHLDIFDEGQWMRLFSKPGYTSIPAFIDYCLGEATDSETDADGNNRCTSWEEL